MKLPEIHLFKDERELSLNSVLICAEGFEDRSLSFLGAVHHHIFKSAIVLTYSPTRKSRLQELIQLCKRHSVGEPQVLTFNRFEPVLFEGHVQREFARILPGVDEVVLDISVMSKLMIMILLVCLRTFTGRIRVVYVEPVEYKPTQAEYSLERHNLRRATTLPSWGVHDVVRTPLLTSVLMQRSPTVAIAFTSFNEQLIRALLSGLNPTHLLLINGVPPSLTWREAATQEIHSEIIKEYRSDNPLTTDGRLQRRASTLHYQETFSILADAYRTFGVTNRIVIAPTGSKMQAISCALIKLCCSDIHIEYPTPESYLLEGYSSPEVKAIHQFLFDDLATVIRDIAEAEGLNE
jgi:hypothetical protein